MLLNCCAAFHISHFAATHTRGWIAIAITIAGCAALFIWNSCQSESSPVAGGILTKAHIAPLPERCIRERCLHGCRYGGSIPAEGPDEFVTLDAVARHADIITFHTPLDNSTRHMADTAGRSLLIFLTERGRGPRMA